MAAHLHRQLCGPLSEHAGFSVRQLRADIALGPKWLCWDFCKAIPDWAELFAPGDFEVATEFVIQWLCKKADVDAYDELYIVDEGAMLIANEFKGKAVSCMVSVRAFHRRYPELSEKQLELCMLSSCDGRHLVPGVDSPAGGTVTVDGKTYGPFDTQTHFCNGYILTQLWLAEDDTTVKPALVIEHDIADLTKGCQLRINSERDELGFVMMSQLNKKGMAFQHGIAAIKVQPLFFDTSEDAVQNTGNGGPPAPKPPKLRRMVCHLAEV